MTSMKKIKSGKVFLFVLILVLWAIVFATMFYKLGCAEVCQTDEATHGVNAYEMIQSGNWIVNTYRYCIDYFNSKPPLSLWLIKASYMIFGYSSFALRFPAALIGFLSCVLITIYLIRKEGILSGIFFAAAFPTMTALVEFHAFRSGDMDSLYCALFAFAMIALLEVRKGRKRFLYLYGFMLGLAIMTKGIHAGMIFLIGLLMLPQIVKRIDKKTVLISFLSAIFIPVIWMAARYRFDGTRFIWDCVIDEFTDKTSGNGISLGFYAKEIISSKCYLLMVITTVLDLFLLIRKKSCRWKPVLREWVTNRYPMLLWALLPFLAYSMTGANLAWYIYPGYFGAVYLTAINSSEIVCSLGEEFAEKKEKTSGLLNKFRMLPTLFTIIMISFCLAVSSRQLVRLSASGEGGNPALQFCNMLQEFKDRWGDRYDNCKVFILYSDHTYADVDYWENDFVYYGETVADFVCENGGIDGFLQDSHSLIIVDDELWDEYSQYLTGYVELEDNGYLIFSHDRY